MSILIALNLHLLTDSKALDRCCIQSHSPLTICLIAVGGNRSARRKSTLKSQSGTIPHIPVMIFWWNPHSYIAMIYQWNSSVHSDHNLVVSLVCQKHHQPLTLIVLQSSLACRAKLFPIFRGLCVQDLLWQSYFCGSHATMLKHFSSTR